MCLVLVNSDKWFFKVDCSASLPTLGIFHSFNFSPSGGCAVVAPVALICIWEGERFYLGVLLL